MPTQQAIADHLDLSQGAVSQLLAELAIDWNVATMDDIRVAYIRRLREIAAGRATSGDLDLATERAALARAQRERIELQNAQTREELAPVAIIEQVLSKAAGRVAGIFDAIPGAVHRRLPALTADDIAMIGAEIAKARNEVSSMSLSFIREDDFADVSSDEGGDA